MHSTLFYAVVGLLGVHVLGWIALIRNLRHLHWPAGRRSPAKKPQPAVTVIVPARNEAADIEMCVRSLLGQQYDSLEVIAVNDHSSDATPQILDRLTAEDARLKVIHDPELQDGWLGKHNAMQAALQHASGELVLLTDADVEFQPTCVAAAVGELQSHELDFLSLYPRVEFVTFCETMLLPIYVAGTALLLSPEAQKPGSSHAMAIGAFILVRAERLNEVGGFDAVKHEILDDVGMAKAFKRRGFPVGLRSAPDLLRVRIFKSNRHAFWGVTKHMMGLVQACVWLTPVICVLPLAMYVTLFAGLAVGIVERQWWLAGVAAVTLLLHYGSLLAVRPFNRFSALKALLFPCISIQFAAGCLAAAWLYLTSGRFRWRGRETNLRAARQES